MAGPWNFRPAARSSPTDSLNECAKLGLATMNDRKKKRGIESDIKNIRIRVIGLIDTKQGYQYVGGGGRDSQRVSLTQMDL
jgi:hypothetical protein